MKIIDVKYEASDGLVSRGVAYGDPTHPPIIFLHGGGQTRHSWGETAHKVASEGWHVINIDSRGHGDSDWCPEGDYTTDGFVRDLTAIAEQLDRPPVVVGASKGGITALAAEGENPGLLRSLILVDVTPKVEQKGVSRIVNFMTAKPEGYDTLEEIAEAIAAYTGRERTTNLEGIRKNVRQNNSGRYIWHWDPKMVSSALGEGLEQRSVRLLAAAENLKVPTLLVRGEKSDVVSAEGVQQFREAVSHAEFIDVKEASHMVAGDQNTVFSDAVIDFINRLD